MTDLDRLKRALARLLWPLLSRVDHSAHYPATVVAQHSDGSLDLLSTVPQRPNLSRVPIQYGVPGVTMTIANGGAVLVGFLGSDPSLPYVLIYDQASVTSIALLGGTMPVARLGDGCSILLPPTAVFSGTVTTGSGPTPLAGPVTMANPFSGVIDSGQLGALA